MMPGGFSSFVPTLTALAILFTGTLAGCTNSHSEQTRAMNEQSILRVRVADVETGPAYPAIVTSGRLAASSETALSFRSGGTLRSVEVRPGEKVQSGQLLATLESAELSAVVRKARDVLEQNRRDRARAEQLFAREIIARKELDDSRTAEALSLAELRSISYRAQLTLRAPSNGIVQQRLAEPGENVAAGRAVLVLGQHTNDESDFVFRAGITEQEVIRVHLNDLASLSFESFPDRTFSGRVREIGATADAASGAYEIEITLLEPMRRMVAGMIGRVEIQSAQNAQATRSYVPLTAIVEGTQHRARLFLLRGDVAQERGVSIAFLRGAHAALNDPLPAGSRVITDGAELLSDGQRIIAVD
jgi:RND family efflux transporter MFP subunit